MTEVAVVVVMMVGEVVVVGAVPMVVVGREVAEEGKREEVGWEVGEGGKREEAYYVWE